MPMHELPYRDTTVEVEDGETVAEFRERMNAHPDTECLIVGLDGEDVWGVLREEYVVHDPPEPERMYEKFEDGYMLYFQYSLDHPEHSRNK